MKKGVSVEECRACLRIIDEEASQELFRAWYTPWAIPGAIIADDLAKLADIEISDKDDHSKVICLKCFKSLADACAFLISVQRSDGILRKRNVDTTASTSKATDTETSSWPKPILLNKNSIEVEIKQEVLSEDEYNSNYTDQDFDPQMDIKIEPEEIVAPVISGIKVNGAYSLKDRNEEAIHINGSSNYFEEEFLENVKDSTIKQEPMSGDELEQESVPDLPLDCLLCMKSFQSVTGLKAHVISQHSYGTVKRKTDNSTSPVKKVIKNEFVCATCRQSFQTRTDLMVHETCHSKHVCYVCDAKFNTFRQLSRHGARCRSKKADAKTNTPTRPPPRPPRLSRPKPGSSPENQKPEPVRKPSESKHPTEEQIEPTLIPKIENVHGHSSPEDQKPELVLKPSESNPTEEQKVELVLTPKTENVKDEPIVPTQEEPRTISNLLQNIKDEPSHSNATEENSSRHDQDTQKSHLNTQNNEAPEPEYILSTDGIENETCYKSELEENPSTLEQVHANSNLSIPNTDKNIQNDENILGTEQTNQNMEIHLAINPLNDGESILPDKIEDMENVNSDVFEPKLIGTASEISDDATQ